MRLGVSIPQFHKLLHQRGYPLLAIAISEREDQMVDRLLILRIQTQCQITLPRRQSCLPGLQIERGKQIVSLRHRRI